jgi:hypothetical protein
MQMFQEFGYMQRGTFDYKQNVHSKVAGSSFEQNDQKYGSRSHLKRIPVPQCECYSEAFSWLYGVQFYARLAYLGQISSNTYRPRCRLNRITQGLTRCNVEVSSVIERV